MSDEAGETIPPRTAAAGRRILIVDDERLFADAMAASLAGRGYDVSTAPLSGDEALRTAQSERPGVVLLGAGDDVGQALQLGEALIGAEPNLRIVALTDRHDPAIAAEAIRRGFRGYVKKDTDAANIAVVVDTVHRGETLVVETRSESRTPARTEERDAELLARQLTAREREILSLLARAIPSRDIAARLSISPHTVRTHVQGILQKLQVHSRIEAAAFALRHGVAGIPRPIRAADPSPGDVMPGRPGTEARAAWPPSISGLGNEHRASSEGRIRIVLAHRRSLVIHGMRAATAGDPHLQVTGEARDAEDLLRLVTRVQPDVVMLDLSLPGPDAVNTIERVKQASPGSRIVVMDESEEAAMLRPALAAGADAYFTNRSRLTDVLAGVEAVHRGGAVVPPELLGALLDRLLHRRWHRDDGHDRLSSLSRQEREVLRLLAKGSSRAEIARHLGISGETARTHLKNVRRKLGVHSRLEAAAFALQPGIRADLWSSEHPPSRPA